LECRRVLFRSHTHTHTHTLTHSLTHTHTHTHTHYGHYHPHSVKGCHGYYPPTPTGSWGSRSKLSSSTAYSTAFNYHDGRSSHGNRGGRQRRRTADVA